MRKILCPVDFSAASLNAIEFATKIGAKHQASLTLLHVFTEKEFGQALSNDALARRLPQGDMDNLVGYAEEMLQGLTDEVNHTGQPQGLLQCDYHFSYGPLEQQLITYADENNYQLVVMGTAGVKDIYEQYLGSHTAKTVDRAHCPVLCVPQKIHYRRLKKVMYATDYQEEDAAILNQVIAFILPFAAQLEIVHIVRNQNLLDEAVHRDYVEHTRSYLNYEAVSFSQAVYDDALHGIDHYAIEHEVDLVVLMRKHRNFLVRLFEEDATHQLSYFATYPVLIFQEE